MDWFSDRGSIPLISTSPEGRAAKNRGSKHKLVSLSHDGVFGFDSLASTKLTKPLAMQGVLFLMCKKCTNFFNFI